MLPNFATFTLMPYSRFGPLQYECQALQTNHHFTLNRIWRNTYSENLEEERYDAIYSNTCLNSLKIYRWDGMVPDARPTTLILLTYCRWQRFPFTSFQNQKLCSDEGWILDQNDPKSTNQLRKKTGATCINVVWFIPLSKCHLHIWQQNPKTWPFLKKQLANMTCVIAHTFWNKYYDIECCFGECPSIAQSAVRIASR